MEQKDLLNNARNLRRNMTPQEKHLWYDFLRHYPIKIYKQRIIDCYIVDFYCHRARLIIELDGSQHYTPDGKAYDKARSRVLNEHGLYVLRFLNSDVDQNFEGVCYVIEKAINERIALSPDKSGALPKGEPLTLSPDKSGALPKGEPLTLSPDKSGALPKGEP